MNVEANTFTEFANKLTVWSGRVLVIAYAGTALLIWPLDQWLYSGNAEAIAAIRWWRWGIVLTTAVALAFSFGDPKPWRNVQWQTIVYMVVTGAHHGHVLSFASHLDPGFIHFSYIVPAGVAVLLVPPRVRLMAHVVATASFWLAYFVMRPPGVTLDGYGSATILLAVSTTIPTFAIGHLLYIVIATIYDQRHLLSERTTALEDLNRLRSELVANVSHELRTPLTLILAAFRRIRGGDSTPETVESGLRNSARLLLLIQQLLDAARSSTSTRAAVREQIDIAGVARDVVARFRPSEPDASRLAVESPSGPLWASVDAWGLRTLLYNLVDNALKFTDPETREVRVVIGGDEGSVHIAVEDNGIGIEPGELPHVLDAFRQADGGIRRSRGGAGIGLSLVRDVVRAHGGDVRVESEVGKGTRVSVELPRGDDSPGVEVAAPDLAELHQLAQTAPPSTGQGGAEPAKPRVVVAEDDREMRAYVSSVLSRRFSVVTTANGQEALAAIEEGPCALVVLDVMMPALDGLSVARRLRQQAEEVPVLMLTALTGAEARREAYAAGADDYVTKPFDESELIERASNLVRLRDRERTLTDRANELEGRVLRRGREIADLASKLSTARDDERARLARELHDETAQLATGLRLELALLRRGATDDWVDSSLGRVESLLDDLVGSHRRLIGALRPVELDTLDLDGAIRGELVELERRTGARTSCKVDNCDELSSDMSAAAFRAVQEALTNVTRHAEATRVDVEVRADASSVRVVVLDDGRGFSPEASRGTSYGLRGMRERALAFGGELRVKSAPGEGTRVEWVVPLSRARAS